MPVSTRPTAQAPNRRICEPAAVTALSGTIHIVTK
jgi:hypothetical protein